MSKIQIQYHKIPYGELIIGSYENKLCLCDWRYRRMRSSIDNRLQQFFGSAYTEETSDIIEATKDQLQEYFEFQRKEFDIPLALAGTSFQQRVWHELMKVEYGETSTYLKLSKRIGNEKAVRAVATANGANAISILIPCHRIIGSDGSLVGYAGGLRAKQKLLEIEQNLLAM